MYLISDLQGVHASPRFFIWQDMRLSACANITSDTHHFHSLNLIQMQSV